MASPRVAARVRKISRKRSFFEGCGRAVAGWLTRRLSYPKSVPRKVANVGADFQSRTDCDRPRLTFGPFTTPCGASEGWLPGGDVGPPRMCRSRPKAKDRSRPHAQFKRCERRRLQAFGCGVNCPARQRQPGLSTIGITATSHRMETWRLTPAKAARAWLECAARSAAAC